MSGQKKFKPNLAVCADSLKGSRGIFDCIVDIETMNMHHTFLHIQFIQSQKTAGEFFQTFGLKGNNFQITFLHLIRNRSIQHGVDIALDGCERRTEIMGNIGDEFALVFAVFI